jgi:4-amino-4-deoxy-L-arabinose transferase-like glycosyltransferase
MGRAPAAALLLLALAVVPLAPRIGSWALIEPDEGRNAEIAREMLVEGAWAVPLFNGLPFLDKPPLLFWAIAGAFGTLGVSELAARLPSAAAMVATIGLTAALGRTLLDSRRAFLAAVVFASCPMALVFAGLVIFDMPLTAFVMGALYCLVRARQDAQGWRWTVLAGLAMGLAVLTKGPVGVATPLLAWVAARGALPAERGHAWWARALVTGLVVILVVGPWLFLAVRQEPNFLHYALFDETLQRLTSSARFRRGGPIYYYAGTLAWGLGIWTPVLAVLAPTLVRLWRAGGPDARAIAFCVRATLALVVFFSLSASKRSQYILPALVPLSVLIAVGVAANPLRLVAVVRAAAWAAAIGGIAMLAGLSVRGEHLSVWKDLPIPSIVLTVAVTLALWGVATAILGRRPAIAVACAALIAPCLALALARPLATYAELRSSRAFAAAIPSDAPVIAFDTFRTALPFYLGRPVLLLSRSGAALTVNYVISQRARLEGPTLMAPRLVRSLLDGAPRTYVLASRANASRLRRMARHPHLVRVHADQRSILFRSDRRTGAPAGPPPDVTSPPSSAAATP